MSLAFLSPTDFQPVADIVIWDPTLAPADLTGPIPGDAVKLVIEVADASLADDLGEKLEDYASAGVAEYWVADVQARQVLRHDGPGDGRFARRAPAPLDAAIDALTIPGLSVTLA